jgi:selenoprotein W-related protein
MMEKARITITYCTKCRWLLRAAWLGQELLTTFENEIAELALIPDSTGGVFLITAGDKVIFSREKGDSFQDIKEIKQRIRDHIAPGKALGHSDRYK